MATGSAAIIMVWPAAGLQGKNERTLQQAELVADPDGKDRWWAGLKAAVYQSGRSKGEVDIPP